MLLAIVGQPLQQQPAVDLAQGVVAPGRRRGAEHFVERLASRRCVLFRFQRGRRGGAAAALVDPAMQRRHQLVRPAGRAPGNRPPGPTPRPAPRPAPWPGNSGRDRRRTAPVPWRCRPAGARNRRPTAAAPPRREHPFGRAEAARGPAAARTMQQAGQRGSLRRRAVCRARLCEASPASSDTSPSKAAATALTRNSAAESGSSPAGTGLKSVRSVRAIRPGPQACSTSFKYGLGESGWPRPSRAG